MTLETKCQDFEPMPSRVLNYVTLEQMKQLQQCQHYDKTCEHYLAMQSNNILGYCGVRENE